MKNKNLLYLIVVIALFVIALTHFELIGTILSFIGNIILPIIIGLILAFVLNVPVCGIENLLSKLFSKNKRKPNQKLIHILSIIITLICVLSILSVLAFLVVPELIKTFKNIYYQVYRQIPHFIDFLEKNKIDASFIEKQFSSFDINNFINKFTSSAGNFIGEIAGFASSTVSAVVSFCIGIVIALYVLISKKTLSKQAKMLIYAYLKKNTSDRIVYISRKIQHAYKSFFASQCLEAVILGILIFLGFLIFGLPYAGLIGTVTAICALIPYIGATISLVLAVLLTLLVAPDKALIALIVYLCIQFIENQFIYPRVVGGSVGLSPVLTIIAVLVGGKLFGFVGMIFFIPLFAVIYDLIREKTYNKLKEKDISI